MQAPSSLTFSPRRKFRQTLFRVHTWLGLHMCLVLGLLFFSGVLALFTPEMDVGARPDLYVSPSANANAEPDYGAIYDRVMAEENASSVVSMYSPKRPWFGHMVEYKTEAGRDRVAWIHPASGEIMGTTPPDPLYIKKFVLRLHDTFMIPLKEVHIAVMLFSLVLLTSILTGLITYRRFWKGLFRWPSKTADARGRQGAWHRLIAVWTLPFLLIMAISSFLFLVAGLIIKPQYGPLETTSTREIVLPAGFSGASVNAALARVREDLPTFEAEVIRIPQSQYRPIVTTGFEVERFKMFGVSTMHIDPMTGESLGIRRAYSDSVMAVVVSLAESFHFGAFAGQWAVLLWAVLGLLGCLLFLTGARIYAARTVAEAGGSVDGRGTFAILWQGLGIFRWAYLLFGLAVVGSTVAQAVI